MRELWRTCCREFAKESQSALPDRPASGLSSPGEPISKRGSGGRGPRGDPRPTGAAPPPPPRGADMLPPPAGPARRRRCRSMSAAPTDRPGRRLRISAATARSALNLSYLADTLAWPGTLRRNFGAASATFSAISRATAATYRAHPHARGHAGRRGKKSLGFCMAVGGGGGPETERV